MENDFCIWNLVYVKPLDTPVSPHAGCGLESVKGHQELERASAGLQSLLPESGSSHHGAEPPQAWQCVPSEPEPPAGFCAWGRHCRLWCPTALPPCLWPPTSTRMGSHPCWSQPWLLAGSVPPTFQAARTCSSKTAVLPWGTSLRVLRALVSALPMRLWGSDIMTKW